MTRYPGWDTFTTTAAAVDPPAPARRPRARPRDLEYPECVLFAEWLEKKQLSYTHIPMGELRPFKVVVTRAGKAVRYSRAGLRLQRMGAKPGVSDYFIADSPPKRPELKGCWYEMKSEEGDKPTEHQMEWLSAMEAAGYLTGWGRGFAEARRFMEEVGGY